MYVYDSLKNTTHACARLDPFFAHETKNFITPICIKADLGNKRQQQLRTACTPLNILHVIAINQRPTTEHGSLNFDIPLTV
jgi:hypothetical protein